MLAFDILCHQEGQEESPSGTSLPPQTSRQPQVSREVAEALVEGPDHQQHDTLRTAAEASTKASLRDAELVHSESTGTRQPLPSDVSTRDVEGTDLAALEAQVS